MAPSSNLLCLVNSTHQVIQAVDPKLRNDGWLCGLLTAHFYHALDLTLNSTNLNSTSISIPLLQSHQTGMGNATCLLGSSMKPNVSAH